MAKEIIATEKAAQAIGPYSQAVKSGNHVFTSGQIGIDPATGKMVEGGIEAQTHQVLANLKAVLEAAGSSFDRVVKTTCFLTDLDDFATFNGIYANAFPNNPPARSTVQVAKLPGGAVVEIECVAECD